MMLVEENARTIATECATEFHPCRAAAGRFPAEQFPRRLHSNDRASAGGRLYVVLPFDISRRARRNRRSDAPALLVE